MGVRTLMWKRRDLAWQWQASCSSWVGVKWRLTRLSLVYQCNNTLEMQQAPLHLYQILPSYVHAAIITSGWMWSPKYSFADSSQALLVHQPPSCWSRDNNTPGRCMMGGQSLHDNNLTCPSLQIIVATSVDTAIVMVRSLPFYFIFFS